MHFPVLGKYDEAEAYLVRALELSQTHYDGLVAHTRQQAEAHRNSKEITGRMEHNIRMSDKARKKFEKLVQERQQLLQRRKPPPLSNRY